MRLNLSVRVLSPDTDYTDDTQPRHPCLGKAHAPTNIQHPFISKLSLDIYFRMGLNSHSQLAVIREKKNLMQKTAGGVLPAIFPQCGYCVSVTDVPPFGTFS